MKVPIVLMALVLAAPSFALTVESNEASVTAPAINDNASQLAAIVLPREATIAVRLPRFESAYADDIVDSERLVALEKTQPGITAAVAKAAREEAAKAYGSAIDLLQVDVASIYRRQFAASELVTLTEFFSSATGQAMVAMSAGSTGETASAFEADRRANAMAFLKNLDDNAKADLSKLMQSGLLAKVREINPEISALSARRFEDVSSIVEALLPNRIDATIAAFPTSIKP